MKKARRQKTKDDGSLAGTLTSGGWKNFATGANAIADAENGIAGRMKGLLGAGRAKKKNSSTPDYASAYANKPDAKAAPKKRAAVKPQQAAKKTNLGGHRGS